MANYLTTLLRRRIIASQPHIVTKSGEIVTFSTPISIPLKSLILSLSPIQSGEGDPYPPGGSPQRWDEEWELGNISPDTGENSSSSNRIRSTNYVPVNPETTYYIKTPETVGFRFYDSSKTFLGSSYNITKNNDVFTTPAGCYYLRFIVTNVTVYANNISLNYPSTDHDYHAWSNERPITGHTSASLVGTGKNLYNPDLMAKDYVNASAQRPCVKFTKPGTYHIKALKTGESSGLTYVIVKNADGTYGTAQAVVNGTTVNNRTVTITEGQTLIVYGGASSSATVATVQQAFADWGIIVSPQDMTTYEAYSGQTHTVSWE